MPFEMTHLHIAKNVYEYLPKENINLSQFYLGNVAPDAVHYRENYTSDFKKTSHLCTGKESWGSTTNNDEWIENVLYFLRKYRDNDNYDFILGYCTHILSDIYNNITVWTPLKLKYPDEMSKGYDGLYYQESEKVDIELALLVENKDNFWTYLEKSEGVTLESFIYENEIEKHKENILFHWYKDKGHQNLALNKIVTIDSTTKFIREASCYVISQLNRCME